MHDTDHELIRSLGATPRLPHWQPVRVNLLSTQDDGQKRTRADLPWLGEHVLVLRPAAVSTLTPLLEEWGEFLPLSCPTADLTLYHALTEIDALDEEASEIIRFDDGTVLAVDSYAFRPEKITAPVFTVPQLPHGPLFVSEDIAAAAADLHGTDFTAVF
ncbi:hypothetical protein ACFPM7_15930 [Actinokineospora guangxiensis]|uniref:Uncharacterized protein n=1 Tax=Actinokineospora guangxiensis TaxID=1490288 RepID=A0ABW0EMI3_9PSEU